MTIQECIERLKEGNNRFVTDHLNGKWKNSSRRESLIDGQDPFAIILGCSDSRVVPELVFDTGLGDLFVVRVAGNVANTSSIASVEYAVVHYRSKLIVVLGHQNCGAVTAAVNGGDNGSNLNHLLSHITPSIEASGGNLVINDVVKKNAELTIEEMKKRSEIIREAIDNGTVNAIPAYYNLDSGKVNFLD